MPMTYEAHWKKVSSLKESEEIIWQEGEKASGRWFSLDKFYNTKESNSGKLGVNWEGPYIIDKVGLDGT